ncbi:recombinase family protein [Propionigenium maris]|uniref:recombinase family protein n=1 Tax=Propionigenium maris TaxID=45622 RepID=UPI0035A25A6B
MIHHEAFTGTTHSRPDWIKLQRKLKKEDTLVFDSVSRMSRDSKEGTKKYFHLRENGINLVFLKESR